MNKWSGKVGFIKNVQDPVKPTKYVETAIEHEYFGDILENTHKWETGLSTNDDLNLSARISIIADGFMKENLQYMKYVEFSGALWKIRSIKPQSPRLILEIGGVWNGKRANS